MNGENTRRDGVTWCTGCVSFLNSLEKIKGMLLGMKVNDSNRKVNNNVST